MLLIWRGMDAAASAVVNAGARQHLKAASVSLRAKLVNVTLALDSTRFLRKETEYIPWEAATRNLRNFVVMFQHTEAFGPIQACVTNPAQPTRPKSTPKITLTWSCVLLQMYLRNQVEHLYDFYSNFTDNCAVPHEQASQ